ncbi:MAG: xanthine dehydrogenase family protein molybdopterin-binding subunit [Acidiferrobacterales bacterium]
MGEMVAIGRRNFLKITAAAGGGLLVGFYLPERASAGEPVSSDPAAFVPNAWIRVGTDDVVTLMVASSEMGQGVMTAIPMLAADEMDADWSRVRIETAPAARAYFNPLIGQQLTGGSTAVRAFWMPVRQAGAAARAVLLDAAAETWQVPAAECRTENGAVIHPPSGRRLGYGALARRAATLPVPKTVFLKEPSEFRLIGTPVPRVDTHAKVTGKAVFGQDVQLRGMLTALVLRCPVFGGKLAGFEAAAALAVPGVRRVFAIDSGVAVVADGFWPAKVGRDALRVRWEEGALAGLSSALIEQRFQAAARRPGAVARSVGNAGAAEVRSARKLDAIYQVPYLAHACMEPMNCTADVRPDGCDIWVPTQAQTGAQQTAVRITGLAEERVRIHTTFLGGGFGRRSEQDFVAEAVQISKAVGAPVKLQWTREDDMRHDFYRPATYNRLSAGIGAHGALQSWRHHIVGPSIFARVFPKSVKNGIDPTSVEGAANLPYAVPNIHVSYVLDDPGVPVGFWRSVGSSQNTFVTECFLDEIAHATGKDPYQLRRSLLKKHPRHLAVLELAASKAGWGSPSPPGRHRGIAVAGSFGSYVAEVAEVSISERGRLRVHRVVCAVDCGMVVNPDTVVAQMESAIVFGLSAALADEITIKDGRVQQSNFDNYPVLRMDNMPEIEVHIVHSAESPGGIGEPGTPPIAPAVANAVFAATGRPVRRLPIRVG